MTDVEISISKKITFTDNYLDIHRLPLTTYVDTVNGRPYFYSDDVWKYIDNVSQGYQALIPEFFGNQRYFGCVSIIGCKDVTSETSDLPRFGSVIDRNQIVCEPIVFTKIEEKDVFYIDLKRLHLEYLLALGIKRSSLINELIQEFTASVK